MTYTLEDYAALRKLTASKIAEETGLSLACVTRLMRHQRRPTLATVETIKKWSRGKVSKFTFEVISDRTKLPVDRRTKLGRGTLAKRATRLRRHAT